MSRGVIGKYPSLKLKRMVGFESLLERDFIYILDFEPGIQQFKEQPLTIQYLYQGKTCRYTPDFHFKKGRAHYLVECKPTRFVNTEENQRKFDAARSWSADNGMTFQIVTDSELRSGYRLENIKLLTEYARYGITPALEGRILSLVLDARNPILLSHLITTVADRNALPAILHLVFHHKIHISLADAPVNSNSLVSLKSRENGDDHL